MGVLMDWGGGVRWASLELNVLGGSLDSVVSIVSI